MNWRIAGDSSFFFRPYVLYKPQSTSVSGPCFVTNLKAVFSTIIWRTRIIDSGSLVKLCHFIVLFAKKQIWWCAVPVHKMIKWISDLRISNVLHSFFFTFTSEIYRAIRFESRNKTFLTLTLSLARLTLGAISYENSFV